MIKVYQITHNYRRMILTQADSRTKEVIGWVTVVLDSGMTRRERYNLFCAALRGQRIRRPKFKP